MTTFDRREADFESKFAHDAELEFRVQARRDKLFGLWAAGLLGLDAVATDAYVRSVISADLAEPGPEDVYRKVRADLTAGNVAVTDAEVRAAMDATLVEARNQLLAAG